MDTSRDTHTHFSHVPFRAMFKYNPRSNTKLKLCKNKEGIITENIPIAHDKRHNFT